MDDIIKRQDAIDAIETTTWYHQNEKLEMVSGANSKEHQAWYKAEDIFDALNNVPSIDDLSSVAQDIAQIIINEMDMRRWLTTERKKGKWLKNERSMWSLGTCSVCGKLSVEADKASYCPFCGADMKGEKNE